MVALGTDVVIEQYNKKLPRGSLIIYGGVLAYGEIRIARFKWGSLENGYLGDYRLDPRLLRMPPPFFPVTGRYITYSWEEMDPPEA